MLSPMAANGILHLLWPRAEGDGRKGEYMQAVKSWREEEGRAGPQEYLLNCEQGKRWRCYKALVPINVLSAIVEGEKESRSC